MDELTQGSIPTPTAIPSQVPPVQTGTPQSMPQISAPAPEKPKHNFKLWGGLLGGIAVLGIGFFVYLGPATEYKGSIAMPVGPIGGRGIGVGDRADLRAIKGPVIKREEIRAIPPALPPAPRPGQAPEPREEAKTAAEITAEREAAAAVSAAARVAARVAEEAEKAKAADISAIARVAVKTQAEREAAAAAAAKAEKTPLDRDLVSNEQKAKLEEDKKNADAAKSILGGLKSSISPLPGAIRSLSPKELQAIRAAEPTALKSPLESKISSSKIIPGQLQPLSDAAKKLVAASEPSKEIIDNPELKALADACKSFGGTYSPQGCKINEINSSWYFKNAKELLSVMNKYKNCNSAGNTWDSSGMTCAVKAIDDPELKALADACKSFGGTYSPQGCKIDNVNSAGYFKTTKELIGMMNEHKSCIAAGDTSWDSLGMTCTIKAKETTTSTTTATDTTATSGSGTTGSATTGSGSTDTTTTTPPPPPPPPPPPADTNANQIQNLQNQITNLQQQLASAQGGGNDQRINDLINQIAAMNNSISRAGGTPVVVNVAAAEGGSRPAATQCEDPTFTFDAVRKVCVPPTEVVVVPTSKKTVKTVTEKTSKTKTGKASGSASASIAAAEDAAGATDATVVAAAGAPKKSGVSTKSSGQASAIGASGSGSIGAGAASASRIHGAGIQGQSGPGILLYPLAIAAVNSAYFFVRKRKK